MQQLEPTYLRYVYDGLSKGSISSNNPTSLPIGFIGLFEDEFPSSMPLVERMSILNRLAIWALLKGPVSIEMIAEVLNEHPDNTKVLIDTYSKWFNSPEPGKYVLYHDRLRTYLLQKLSNHEVQDLNETLISYLENSLNSEGSKEAETYALEHLSTHMAVESQMGNNYDRLHEFVNQEDLWKRQVSESYEYKWSQRAIQYSIKEGARRHNEINTLESTVNSLKLSHKEQNSAEQIINFLNLGDYEIALKRALFFNDTNLFKIYLLMLYELLLGGCKNEAFTKDVCKIIFNNIDKDKDNFTNRGDQVLINYPKKLILELYFKLTKIGIDATSLLEFTSFNFDTIYALIENGDIEINDLIKYDLFTLIKDKYLNINSISKLFEKFHEIENTSRNSNLIDEFLSLLNGFIKKYDFSKELLKNSIEAHSALEVLDGLNQIIASNNLFSWLKEEELDVLILNEFESICNKHPQFASSYAKLLFQLERNKEAIDILDNRVSKSTEIANYVISNNWIYKEIAILFFKNGNTKDANYILEKISGDKDVFLAQIYIEFCLHSTKQDNSEINKKYIEKIQNVLYTIEDIDTQPKRKKTLNYYYGNIDLHIGMFNLYVKSNNKKLAKEHIQFALELNNLICNKFLQDIEKNQQAFRRKYKTLGKICNQLSLNGFNDFSKKLVADFSKSIISLGSKKYISQSIDYMYSEMLGLFIDEFTILNEKYPLHNIVGIGKVLNLTKNNIDDFINIENYVHLSADKEMDFFEDKSAYLKIILERNLKDYSLWNSNKFKSFLEYVELNDKKIIKFLGEDFYDNYLKKLYSFRDFSNLKKIIIESLNINLIKSDKIYYMLQSKLGSPKQRDQKVVNNVDGYNKSDDEHSLFFNHLNNLEKKIENGSCNFNDIQYILSQREKLYNEDKEIINYKLIPILVKSNLLDFDFILSLLEEIDDPHLRSKNYFHFALFLLNKCVKSDNEEFGWQHNNNEIIINNDNGISSDFLNKEDQVRKILILACKSIFDIFKTNYNHEEFLINLMSYIDELFLNNYVDDLIFLAKEYKDLLLPIDTRGKESFLTRAPITGKEMPWDYIYKIYETICKKLIDIDRIEDAFSLSNLMVEKNEIANIHIYYINSLANQGNIKDALEKIPSVIKLIRNSEPLPKDNSIWPVKGYSFLKLVEFYIKISQPKNAYKYMEEALSEVFDLDSEILMEAYNYDYYEQYNTHFNEQNKYEFLHESIILYLKLNDLKKSLELKNLIKPNSCKYISGRKALEKGRQGYTINFYKDALIKISNYLFDIDLIRSFHIVNRNKHLNLKDKKSFYDEFFLKSDIKIFIPKIKSIITKDFDLLVNSISSSFIEKRNINDEFVFLSNYSNYTQELKNILLSRTYDYLLSNQKNSYYKLDLLSGVIDVSELTKLKNKSQSGGLSNNNLN